MHGDKRWSLAPQQKDEREEACRQLQHHAADESQKILFLINKHNIQPFQDGLMNFASGRRLLFLFIHKTWTSSLWNEVSDVDRVSQEIANDFLRK